MGAVSSMSRSGSMTLTDEALSQQLKTIFPVHTGTQGVNPFVFEALHDAIEEKCKLGELVTYSDAAAMLSMYQKASRAAETYFPGSRPGRVMADQVDEELTKHGFTPQNTLMGQSVCADEVNHVHNSFTMMMKRKWGERQEAFNLGGLAGVPFAGKTGFGAFSHHIKDNGDLLVVFAPHVGLGHTEDGTIEVGKLNRLGQSREYTVGAACGAAKGAFAHCKSGGHVMTESELGSNALDFQMQYIIHEVNKRWKSIDSKPTEDAKQAALTYEMYKICKDFVEGIVDAEAKCYAGKHARIVVLGGIQVNMPYPMADYFQPLTFMVFEHGKPPVDLLESAFYGPKKGVNLGFK